MRSEKQVYDTILNFARMNERIRVVTLEGSRTNINIPPDDFQDYDITFFVTDMQSFINDDNWLNVFGERLILQKPEDMELFPAVEKGFSYLMLFTDDVKIDLTLPSPNIYLFIIAFYTVFFLLPTYIIANFFIVWRVWIIQPVCYCCRNFSK